MPLRQQVVLAVRRQPQRGEILRRGAQSRGDEDHALGINLMQGAYYIVVSAIQGGQIAVQFVGGFINHIKTERRMLATKKLPDRCPPGHQLRFGFCVGLGFKAIGLIRDDRRYAIGFAGFDQLTQVNQPRFGHIIRHANTDMANAGVIKITHHQRVKFADAALGTRPVNVHADAQLLRVTRRRQRRIGGIHSGCRQQHNNSNQWL